ncbi:MAG: FtsB family cell division protein [Caldilineaceae bacterium]
MVSRTSALALRDIAVTAHIEPAMSASPSPDTPAEERSSSRPLLILLIAICTLMIVTYAARLDERDGVQGAIAEQRVLNEEAKQRTAGLQRELLSVNRPAYVDEVARRDLGMGKEGDVVIVAVTATGATDAGQSAREQAPALLQPIWRQWLTLFTPEM